MLVSCTEKQDCKKVYGLDADIPQAVQTQVKSQGYVDHVFADRFDCDGKLYWQLIKSKDYNKADHRYGSLVIYDKQSGETEVYLSE